MTNKKNNNKNITPIIYFFNDKIKISSTTVEDKDFEKEVEKLMEQELVYGDSNYY